MYTATIYFISGQTIQIQKLSAKDKDSLVNALGTEARWVHNNGASIVAINLATVERVTFSGPQLKAH